MKQATFIKRQDGNGTGKVFKVEPPMPNDRGGTTEYVWVSASVVPFTGPETYIFPCNEHGEVSTWGELDGSYRGGLSHETALRNAGYEVTDG